MESRTISLFSSVAALCFATVSMAQPLMTVQSVASGGSSVTAMANRIIDSSADYSFVNGSASDAINNPAGISTDERAFGEFSGGNVPSGASLQDPVDPSAVFAGGIGMDGGVCLCTGFLDDNEPTAPSTPVVPTHFGLGVQGPNNGFPIDPPVNNHEGEVSLELLAQQFANVSDADFTAVHNTLPQGGDPAVLEFNVALSKPGFLRVRFVFATDEHPFWTSQINDSIVILVRTYPNT